MNYKIADFSVEIRNLKYEYFKKSAKIYETEEKADFTFEISDKDIENEKIIEPAIEEEELHEFTAILRKFGEFLPLNNGLILHSACFEVDGIGVAFCAHSGTGKTTHMRIWKWFLKDRFTVVNGDKPMIRFFDDEPDIPYAYGSPWNGKENMGNNMRTPLKHICFIERSETNYVEKCDKSDVLDRVMNQIYMPKNSPMGTVNTMQLINRLLECCDLWIIHCNKESVSAEIAYKAIFENK